MRYFGHAMDQSFLYVALEPFVALPLATGRAATSLTLAHIVQRSRPSNLVYIAEWAGHSVKHKVHGHDRSALIPCCR